MIKLNNITFSYSRAAIVFHGFGMELPEGKIVGLLGKNGMGKSTLLYLIAGLLRPAAGTVEVDGRDMAKRSADSLADMFIVPEEFELPDVGLGEYVATQRAFYPRFSDETLAACLAEFELASDMRLGRLSMGQRKKVLISLALAAGTRLLLMDEPTNGLDIPGKAQFRRVVAQSMDDSRTMIVSTHQVHDIEAMVDYIAVLDSGRATLCADCQDIAKRYYFGPGAKEEALYSLPSPAGLGIVRPRAEGEAETEIDMELLFGAAVEGKINI